MKDYLLLFDNDEKLKRIINSYEFYDDEINSTVLGEIILNFKTKDEIVDIEKGNKIGVLDKEGELTLFIVEQVEAETIYSTELKVTCIHDFYTIAEEKAITQYESPSISLRDAVTIMLKGTSYELGECVEKSFKSIGPYLFKNVLWCMQNIIEVFGAETYYSIELDETRTKILKKKINIVNALGSDTGIRCSADLNVSKISRIEKDKFYTVMYGCGSEYQKDLVKYKYSFKDIQWSKPNNPVNKPLGEEYIEDKDAIKKYGRKIGIYEDGRIKDPELLLKKTWESLQKNNKPFISYELDIEELKTEDGYEHLDFKLGDLIILQNTNDNSRAKFRIIEDVKSVSDKSKRKITIGEQVRGLSSGNGTNVGNGGGNVIPPGGDDINPDIEDLAPDILPNIPSLKANGLFATVQLEWSYENKMYYDYEVYASKLKDFEPTVFNLICSGKFSAFLHEVKPKEVWYYKVRAGNTYGNYTDFSVQVEAATTKLSDAAEYFEEAAIGHAVIKDLDVDKIVAGKVKGTYINAKNLLVDDGNNVRTLHIDSFGNVYINATTFSLQGKSVHSIAESVVNSQTQLDVFNKLTNNGQTQGIYLSEGKIYINGSYIQAGTIACDTLTTPEGHYPIIKLFGDECGIDATHNFGVGKGEAIRLKYDNSNYLKINENGFAFYTGATGGTKPFNVRPIFQSGVTHLLFGRDGSGYIKILGSGEGLQVRDPYDSDYANMRANKFLVPGQGAGYIVKKNNGTKENVLDKISRIYIYENNVRQLNNESSLAINVDENTPNIILNNGLEDETSVDLYSLSCLMIKGMQEQSDIIKNLQTELNKLKEKVI